MRKSESIKNIAKALSECQAELKDVFKGANGYNYKYATLDKVYDEIRPKMTKHGLSLTHSKSYNRDSNTINIISLLMHTSGEWIEYEASVPYEKMRGMNDFQSAGSGFTYLERYQTSAIFAITADEDNDAQGEPQQQPTPREAFINKYRNNQKMLAYIKKTYKKDINQLTAQEVNTIIKAQKAKK